MNTDYPHGDGLSTCLKCKGRGVVSVSNDQLSPMLFEATKPCICVRARDIRDHLEHGWKGLSSAKPIKESPLRDQTNASVWITASLKSLQEHLCGVAIRQGISWFFRVITDIDLMTTWLSSADDVFDADVAEQRQYAENTYSRLTDLVEPPKLLIIRLGAKAARNVATPEVLFEALLHRQHLSKPTWVVDSPSAPLDPTHLAYSQDVMDHLQSFKRVTIDQVAVAPKPAFTTQLLSHDPEPLTNKSSSKGMKLFGEKKR